MPDGIVYGTSTIRNAAIRALQERPVWYSRAACKGKPLDLFYPQAVSAADVEVSSAAALAICARCPVREQCAAAGKAERYGIWGGQTERQRQAARRRRPAA
jgi:WhiB family redox-sensing transcriptional regulator